MKNIKNLLLTILLAYIFVPSIVKADVLRLDYSYDKIAKLGNEAEYKFSVDSNSYEYFITYDKNMLKLKDTVLEYLDICVGEPNIKIEDNNGKITVRKDANDCSYKSVKLVFTTLKEGTTKLDVVGGKDTTFGSGGKAQQINISTEIIDVNKECESSEKVEECEKCEVCQEIKESTTDSSENIITYILLCISLVLNIVTIIIILKKSKFK